MHGYWRNDIKMDPIAQSSVSKTFFFRGGIPKNDCAPALLVVCLLHHFSTTNLCFITGRLTLQAKVRRHCWFSFRVILTNFHRNCRQFYQILEQKTEIGHDLLHIFPTSLFRDSPSSTL